MRRWLRSLFAWHFHHHAGAWIYSENHITGQRAADYFGRGYSPIDFDWLDDGIGHPRINGIPAWRTAQGQSRQSYFN